MNRHKQELKAALLREAELKRLLGEAIANWERLYTMTKQHHTFINVNEDTQRLEWRSSDGRQGSDPLLPDIQSLLTATVMLFPNQTVELHLKR